MDKLESLIVYLLRENPSPGLVKPSEGYMEKEQLMQLVQNALRRRGDELDSQEALISAVDEEIEKIKSDMDLTFEMIREALVMVPFDAFKEIKPPAPEETLT